MNIVYPFPFVCRAFGTVTTVIALGGCVANSSNPVIAMQSAELGPAEATIALDITNPGGRDLEVVRVDYELSHGETVFPVATGSWEGELALPAGDHATLFMHIPFDTEPIEIESRLLHLTGQMETRDLTGFFGIPSLDLGSTSFQLDATATEHSEVTP